MPDTTVTMTFEGTPEEIGLEAAIQMFAPVIESAMTHMPACAHDDLCAGILSGLGAVMCKNIGFHHTAALALTWARAMQRMAEEKEGPRQ